MNVVKEISRINERELELGGTASWHDEYKDSAYIFVGGLPYGLTEGDLISICSQYGEVMDVNMPRDSETGKTKGFGFIMYEDQRSTILAVDNLNGGKVLDRTIRVDHVKNYKQKKVKNGVGDMVEPEEQSLNAKPELIQDDRGEASDDGSVSSIPSIDPEDPMRDYLLAKHKEEKLSRKLESGRRPRKRRREDETPEERRLRKERKRARREARAEGDRNQDRDKVRLRSSSHRRDSPNREYPGRRHPSPLQSSSHLPRPSSPRRRNDDDYRSGDKR